jgi:hypothetical protein
MSVWDAERFLMGTTEGEQPEYRGIIAKAGHQYDIITTVVAETAYGRRGGSLYPIVLLAVTAMALVLTAGATLLVGVGLLSSLLLALWVGSGGGRR